MEANNFPGTLFEAAQDPSGVESIEALPWMGRSSFAVLILLPLVFLLLLLASKQSWNRDPFVAQLLANRSNNSPILVYNKVSKHGAPQIQVTKSNYRYLLILVLEKNNSFRHEVIT